MAATTVAAAAALVAMAARFSEDLDSGGTIAARADELRAEACELAQRDADSYAAVLAAYQAPRDDDERRRAGIRAALTVATDVPLAIIGGAREVGELGVRLVRDGNRNLRGDAVTAVNLAEAAARSAAYLVQLNVQLGDLGPERRDRAEAWSADLRAAVAAVQEELP